MKLKLPLPLWAIVAPVFAWLAYAGIALEWSGVYIVILTVALIGGVLAAVYHAEVVAHRVGEPFGTLVLAIAVTFLEVSLIVSLMLAGGSETTALARDTVFAAVMIILTGIIGICLLSGGARFKEQVFGVQGVSAALVTLMAILTLTLILPNYTTSIAGPVYNYLQQGFIAVVSLILYGTFVLVQTVRHRDFFLPPDAADDEEVHAAPPTNKISIISFIFLLACLGAVVLLAKPLLQLSKQALLALGHLILW